MSARSTQQAVGIITNDEHAVFQQHIILGARDVAQAHGLDVLVDSIAEEPTAPPRPLSLDAGKIAGYLVIAAVLGEKELAALVASGKPVTLVSHHVAGLPIPAVISNNAQGMTRLVRHLIAERGRRQFVYVRGQPNQRDSIERERAFEDELMRWNLPDAHRLRGDFDPHIAS
ncbi:MAG: substrate-binding domain-containing protein, partial [Anaerolineae bacterium]|nr:substrate-binding domain-containing protein [Anaerolineae bacterium]